MQKQKSLLPLLSGMLLTFRLWRNKRQIRGKDGDGCFETNKELPKRVGAVFNMTENPQVGRCNSSRARSSDFCRYRFIGKMSMITRCTCISLPYMHSSSHNETICHNVQENLIAHCIVAVNACTQRHGPGPKNLVR